MKFLFKISVLLLLTGALFTACNKENFDEIVPEGPGYQPEEVEVNNLMSALRPDASGGLALGCITINYPFGLLLVSGDTATVSSDADFDLALSGQGLGQVVDFVYPLSVTDSEGNTVQVADNDELGVAFASCVPDDDWTVSDTLLPAFLFDDWCFDLVYPVSLEDGDGNAYTANNEPELIDLRAAVDPLFFVLPLTVADSTGNTVVISDVDAFFDAVDDCVGTAIAPPVIVGAVFQVEGFACNELVFPFDLELSDGSVVTINDENDYANFVLGNDEDFQLVYPFSLVNLLTGDTLNIDSDDAFIQSFEACGIIIIIDEVDPCDTDAHILLFFNALNIFTQNKYEYDIHYPVTLIVEGTQVVLNNGDEYLPAVGGSPFDLLETEIVYPVTVTQFGREIVLNSDEDVCQFYETLDEPCENKPAHIQFFFNEGGGVPINCAYFINYPLDIVLNGATIQVLTREDYLDELNGSPTAYDEIELVYPVSIYQFDSGQQIFFESDDDICEYLDNCE